MTCLKALKEDQKLSVEGVIAMLKNSSDGSMDQQENPTSIPPSPVIQINLKELLDPEGVLEEIYARYRDAMTTCMQSMTEAATQLACRNMPKSRSRRLRQKWRNLCAECGRIRKRMSAIEHGRLPSTWIGSHQRFKWWTFIKCCIFVLLFCELFLCSANSSYNMLVIIQ